MDADIRGAECNVRLLPQRSKFLINSPTEGVYSYEI